MSMPPPSSWLAPGVQAFPEKLSVQFRHTIALPLSKLARDTMTITATATTTSPAQAQLEELSVTLERVVDVTDEVEKKRRSRRSWVDDLTASVNASMTVWKRGLLNHPARSRNLSDDHDDDNDDEPSVSDELGARDLRILAVELQDEVGGLGMWLNEVGYTDGLPPALAAISRDISVRVIEPLRRWKIRYHMGDDDDPVGFQAYVRILQEIAARIDAELEGVYELFASMDVSDSESSVVGTPTVVALGDGFGDDITRGDREASWRQVENDEDEMAWSADGDEYDEELNRGRSRSPRWGITSAGNGTQERRKAKGGQKMRAFFGFGFTGSGFESPGYSTPGDAGVEDVVPKGDVQARRRDWGFQAEPESPREGKGMIYETEQNTIETLRGKENKTNGKKYEYVKSEEDGKRTVVPATVSGVPHVVVKCTDEYGMRTRKIVGWDTPQPSPSPSHLTTPILEDANIPRDISIPVDISDDTTINAEKNTITKSNGLTSPTTSPEPTPAPTVIIPNPQPTTKQAIETQPPRSPDRNATPPIAVPHSSPEPTPSFSGFGIKPNGNGFGIAPFISASARAVSPGPTLTSGAVGVMATSREENGVL